MEGLEQIKAISDLNNKIIFNIKSKYHQEHTTFRSEVAYDSTRGFTLHHHQIKLSGDNLVKKLTKEIKLSTPTEMFDVGLDFSCKTFEEMEKVNNNMYSFLFENYDNFDKNKIKGEIQIFKENFEKIQVELARIESFLNDTENSNLKEMDAQKKHVDNMNESLQSLQNHHQVDMNLSELEQAKWLTRFTGRKVVLSSEWWDTSDNLGGKRQSTHNPNIYFFVSKNNLWDKYAYFLPPNGYRWISTEEARKIFDGSGSNRNSIYCNQGGWDGYDWNGRTRYYFVFSDSCNTNMHKHAGHYDNGVVDQQSDMKRNFAGIVCEKTN
eukprot:TRINITY_DN891_c0_g2_i1.p1 TRINITY_DN891_c0_g2~~TRINITY_DN891_c0_g2_i1.p1  ORF type:complete len:323 (+),score=59.70 TRINITY_DN891_c0_g2_i1:164-1132(+)